MWTSSLPHLGSDSPLRPPSCVGCPLFPLRLLHPILGPFVFFHLVLFQLMILELNCSGRGKERRMALLCLYRSQNKNSHNSYYPSFCKVKKISNYLWESLTKQLKFYFCFSKITLIKPMVPKYFHYKLFVKILFSVRNI